jgi:hypothetical protein
MRKFSITASRTAFTALRPAGGLTIFYTLVDILLQPAARPAGG